MARILVADDEQGVRDFVSRALTMHGHSVRTASDGAEAADLASRHMFDVLVADIRMPIMDGISLALSLRTEQPEIKILLMTGYSSELQRAHNIGSIIDGILSKPFTLDKLLDSVQHLFHEELWGHNPISPNTIQHDRH